MSQIASLLMTQGTPIVFAATLAARIGVPVPAAPFVVVAGGLAATGQLSTAGGAAGCRGGRQPGRRLVVLAGRRHGYRC